MVRQAKWKSALFIIWIIRHRWKHNMWTWLKWKLWLLIIFHVQPICYDRWYNALFTTENQTCRLETDTYIGADFSFITLTLLWSTWKIIFGVLLRFLNNYSNFWLACIKAVTLLEWNIVLFLKFSFLYSVNIKLNRTKRFSFEKVLKIDQLLIFQIIYKKFANHFLT